MTDSGQRYIASAGQTFDSISLIIYGDEKYSCELLSANPSLCLIPIFEGGEVLTLPAVQVEEEINTRAPWKE